MKLATLFFLSVMAVSLVAQTLSYADVWERRRQTHGYFTNRQIGNNIDYLLPPLYDNLAIPYSVDSAQEFYNFTYDQYQKALDPTWYNNDVRKHVLTGQSFTVNAMLGRNGDEAHRSLTNADWQDFRSRLLQTGVTVSSQMFSSYGSRDSLYEKDIDDVHYYYGGAVKQSLVIRFNGRTVWREFYDCANLIGDPDGLPPTTQTPPPTPTNPTPPPAPLPQWNVSTSIATPRPSVQPGDTITWNYSATQNGPDATDQSVTYGYRDVTGGSVAGTFASGIFANGTGAGTTRSYSSTYVATPADAGKQICRQSYAVPYTRGGGIRASDTVCVLVEYKYELHPRMTIDDETTTRKSVTAGETVNFYHSVLNDGPTASAATNKWMTRCVYAPGQPYADETTEIDNTSTATQTFGSAGQCDVAPLNTSYTDYYFPVGWTRHDPTTVNTSTLATGSHYCYILSVRPPNQAADRATWRHSVPACLTVLKTPVIQILGGDVRAGSVTTSAPRDIAGKSYGSWAEYGIFGIAGITGMSSGGALAQGGTTTSNDKLAALTFANSPSNGNYYSTLPSDDDYTTYRALATTTSGSTSQGGAIGAGDARAIVRVDGDLRITANMTYSGVYGSLAAIPRVIYVVSGNIIVDAGVTRIDPWLITKGTLYTCSDYTQPGVQKLTSGTCQSPLLFSGPVTASKIVLGRTYGADSDPASRGVPAETFTLSPNNFLSGYSVSVSASDIQTVYERELPPRY